MNPPKAAISLSTAQSVVWQPLTFPFPPCVVVVIAAAWSSVAAAATTSSPPPFDDNEVTDRPQEVATGAPRGDRTNRPSTKSKTKSHVAGFKWGNVAAAVAADDEAAVAKTAPYSSSKATSLMSSAVGVLPPVDRCARRPHPVDPNGHLMADRLPPAWETVARRDRSLCVQQVALQSMTSSSVAATTAPVVFSLRQAACDCLTVATSTRHDPGVLTAGARRRPEMLVCICNWWRRRQCDFIIRRRSLPEKEKCTAGWFGAFNFATRDRLTSVKNLTMHFRLYPSLVLLILIPFLFIISSVTSRL